MKAIFFANTDWYLYNFRLDYAKFLRLKGWEIVFLTPDGSHVSKIEAAGFRHISLNFSRKGINPISELNTFNKIKRIYDKEKPDLVHHFTIKCVIYGSLAAKKSGIKAIINSITGLGYMFLSNSIFANSARALLKKLYRTALNRTHVVFENPDDCRLFDKMKISDGAQTNVILGTGIDTDLFIPVTPPDSVPLTILPARMLWDKGIGEFVEAASMIRDRGIKARFALVGKTDEGNPTSITFDQLTKWQKYEIVEWWGWQDDIIAVMSMCNIVCLPSYREGLPKVLIEAASCARPIVTTDVPGCHEVVKDGVNGLLVPVKDSHSLADALIKLIEDKDLRQCMGEEGRKRALSIFSVKQVNTETYSVYNKALNQ